MEEMTTEGIKIFLKSTQDRKMIEESIIKWRSISLGERVGEGTNDCNLCLAYHTKQNKNHCEDCPVRIKTNNTFCKKTPYSEYMSASFGSNAELLAADQVCEFFINLLEDYK